MVFAAVLLGTVALSARAVRAEDVSASGRASMSYEGLVSAVTQEREFDLQVRRDDGQVINAPVQIKGAEGFTGGDLGDVEWKVAGSTVTGTLTKNGQQIMTFEGTAGATEMAGTFRTRGGQTGSWTAPLPADKQ
jgi:hypothetical protein